jgi:hypothetical protein
MRLYLKKNKEGYCIYCLGKSGEPKKGIKIKVGIKSIFRNNMIDYDLVSNQEGLVRLGRLEGVS